MKKLIETEFESSGFTLLEPYPNGPVGNRFVVENKDDGQQYLADFVEVKDEYSRDLCLTAERFHGWTHKFSISNSFQTGLIRDNLFYVVTALPANSLPLSTVKKPPLSEFDTVELALGIFDGLKHLAKRYLVHCALCPDVLYWTRDRVCIGELWWMRYFGGKEAQLRTPQTPLSPNTPTFAVPYQAPEIVECRDFSPRSDYYSFALIMRFLLSGKHPQEWKSDIHSELPDLDQKTVDFYNWLTDPDMKQRPTWMELMGGLGKLHRHLKGIPENAS